jgi:endonuclease/exonuclease/phosphatase family metal-dependent hydrolase
MAALRVMTLNMASGSGMSYVDFTAATHANFINRHNPDVVFLQEVDRGTGRAGGVDQLGALREATSLHDSHFVKWRNLQGGEYGVAILSRLPLRNVENRSVYKPPEWWPWFVTQVVTPVAYATIDVAGAGVDLYATHFPSNNEGRKKFGADQIAASIPGVLNTILGGDLNDGPTGIAMVAIDAKFRPAESIAAQIITSDHPDGVVVGDGIIDRGLDHLYVSGRITCDRWTALFPVEGGRQFSDHPISYADFQLATTAPQPSGLRTSVQPYPAPIDTVTTLTVSAADAASGAAVAGEVLLDGMTTGATNTPFQVTLRRLERRTFDPQTRQWSTEVVDPSLTVRATGYAETEVELGFSD